MAGEIFIARQDTLEEVKQTVNEIDTNVDTVNNTTSETKTQTTGIKADTDGLKLSTDSIKQIADTILERIGLTTDVGGGTTAGSIFAKLNALLSAGGGGITGFKYIKKTGRFSYTTQASGILLGRGYDGQFELTNAYIGIVYRNTSGDSSEKVPYIFGAFAKNAGITSSSSNNETHIFEFI